MPAGLGSLRVLSINVNGLQSSVTKRMAFFQYLAQVQADIVVVQETHCSGDSQAQQWVQRGGGPGSAWQGPTFWQHHTSSSRGVGILLKAGLLPPDCHPVVEYRDDQATEPGRLLRVGWALPGNQHLSVVAVYAPCEAASRPAFFAEAFADAVLQPQFQHSHLIVAGDFNCVLEQRDVQPTLGQPAGNSSRLQGAQDMRLVCQAAALQDAWRTLHPAQCDYTHHSAGQHASAGRIDAVWVSQDLFDAGWVTKVQHLHDAPIGDHAAVLLELQQPDTPPLGPGRWIFPNDLLGLETALADLKAAIEHTYYFHRLGKPPPESQLITEVANPAQPGSTVSLSAPGGTQQAATIFADYYDAATGGLCTVHPTTAADQQLLLAAVDSLLSPEEQRQCLGELPDGSIQEDEAEAALRSLPRGKAPGSDGLTYEFYATLWSEVGDWMIATFNQPYLHGPQQQPRADPNSYRPITLLNCDVKIVAKVQVLRLGSVLPSVIDPTQTAFVPGRQIADNVLCHVEEVDYLQQEQQPGVILFLDFAKAYDRLNRTWIQLCMQCMGFPPGSIRWVLSCWLAFPYRTIAIDAGCAQGNPLSPLLYVIAAQPLAATCRQLQLAAGFKAILLPEGRPAPCSHQHADDTTLHAADIASVRVLLQQAVWQAMWLRLDPAADLMPLDPHLLLVGQGSWAPSQQCAALWEYLRTLMLHSLWVARCSTAGSPSHTAQSVVGRFVPAVKHQAALEWQRVCSDSRWNTGLPFLVQRQRPQHPGGSFPGQVVHPWCRCLMAAAHCSFPTWQLCLSLVSSWGVGGGAAEHIVP
eukprot:gene3744-biopygen5420